MSKMHKRRQQEAIFNTELHGELLSLHRSDVFSGSFNVHFAGIGKSAHDHHVVS